MGVVPVGGLVFDVGDVDGDVDRRATGAIPLSDPFPGLRRGGKGSGSGACERDAAQAEGLAEKEEAVAHGFESGGWQRARQGSFGAAPCRRRVPDLSWRRYCRGAWMTRTGLGEWRATPATVLPDKARAGPVRLWVAMATSAAWVSVA